MLKRITACIFAFALCFSAASAFATDEVITYYVSSTGDDSNSGTADAPLKTLDGARLKVRTGGYLKKKKIDVVFADGTYNVEKTTVFDADDSGSKEFPVTYKADENASVYFEGGFMISYSDKEEISNAEMKKRFLPEAVDNIKVIDLKKYGVTSIVPIARQDPYIESEQSPQRLYVDDKEFVQARWPNGDGWTYTGKVIDPGLNHGGNAWGNTNGFDARGGTFTYTDDRIERYKNIEDVWIFGRFTYDWAPNSTPLINIDKENKTITTKYNSYGPYSKNKPYYYFNVPEELDCQGEYYIDPATKELYFYDEGINESSTIYLTSFGENIIQMKYAQYINFENIYIQGTRTTAVEINSCRGIGFYGCTLRYIGYNAIVFNEGWEYIVDGCEIYHLGRSAVECKSGDIPLLKQSGTRIINNSVHDFNMWDGLGASAIYVNGCGEVVANNEIYNGTKAALGSGCRSVIENNDIYSVMLTADDAGMLYNHSDGPDIDVHIRNNFFHSSFKRGILSSTGTWGVYFDAFGSNYNVYNNIFYDLSGGVHVNGGQFNKIYNNLFVGVEKDFFVHAFTTHSSYVYWIAFENKNVAYEKGIWRQEYPQIYDNYDWSQWRVFKGHSVYNNISVDVSQTQLDGSQVAEKPNVYKNNVKASMDIFADVENYDFTMGDKNPLPGEFTEIDTKKIGVNKRTREEIENGLPDFCKYY